jgi:hypothetical protein
MHEHLAVEARAEHPPADEAVRVRFLNRLLEHMLHVQELAADVDVGDLRADGITGYRAPLDEQVGIALHQQVILERSGLALVCVAGDVARLVGLPIDELPLHAGRKAGAAPPAQPGRLDQLDDLLRLHRQRLAQRFVALVLQIEIERERVRLANVLGEKRIHIRANSWRRL